MAEKLMVDKELKTIERAELKPEIIDFIEVCKKKEHSESYLIAVLHKIQGEYGFLSNEHMYEVAQRLGVPSSKVFGVATFYHFFRLQPKGKHNISICLGTACFVKGANMVLEEFKKETGIELGETSSDGLFSLEGTRCVGVCALAPVVIINDEVFSNVQPNDVHNILNNIKVKDRVKQS